MAGVIETPIETTTNTTTFVPVTLGTYQRCSRFIIQSRGGYNLQVSDVVAGTTYYTIKNGQALKFDRKQNFKAGVLCYVRSEDSADVAETLIER
jgi:hypothetical protein